MTGIADLSIEDDLRAQVRSVAAGGGQIEIVGGGSKQFYGEPVEALPIDVSGHSGIIDYDPAELVITLRAGCPLADVEALLAGKRQMFGFEPPQFGADATIGGMVAAGIAGPRRAFAGGIRDFVLGIKMLDGRGQLLHFGGRVIKNVAGFDLSRVLVGSLGTLGVILEVSIRVVPKPETETTLVFEHETAGEHLRWINGLGSRPYPISASQWEAGRSRLRLSGSEQGLREAVAQLGGDETDYDWAALREQRLEFFDPDQPLTRITLPPTHSDLPVDLPQLIEWGGALRWFSGAANVADLRAGLDGAGASVCAFRGHDAGIGVFHPLPEAMLRLQRSLKSSFDPAGIFNPGRIYPGL
ncbi:MAG: glycolate oxidase subunit GlcE [Gammaproteobacteria bacterium]|jgi:glycolate oxidase FAD binding subunit